MKGKKLLGVSLLSLVLVLASCGTSGNNDSSNSSNDSSSNNSSQNNSSQGGGGSGGGGDQEVEPTIHDNYINPAFAASFEIGEYNKDLADYTDYHPFVEELTENFNNVAPFYYGETYQHHLEFPELNNIASFDDLVYIIDYQAFYGINEVDITFAPSYTADKSEELYKAYWASRMTTHVAGYSFSENAGTYTVNLYYNEFASTAISKVDNYRYKITLNPYQYINSDEACITSIPYTPTSGKLSVTNSDQLLYALYNGYEPVMEENSRVDILYKKASYVLRHIITPSMNDIQKIYAINSYLTSTTNYETYGDTLAGYGFTGDDVYPAKVASTFVSFYAEGPLLYNWGVCAGFAKAESLLMAMLGINHIRTTGADITIAGSIKHSVNSKDGLHGYWFHEYNYYITNEGKYYVCDPTYNMYTYFNYQGSTYSSAVRNFGVCLLKSVWDGIYVNMTDYHVECDSAKIGTVELHPEQYCYIDNTTTNAVSTEAELRNAVAKAKAQVIKFKAAAGITDKVPFYFLFTPSTDDREALMNLYNALFAIRSEEENALLIILFEVEDEDYNPLSDEELYVSARQLGLQLVIAL